MAEVESSLEKERKALLELEKQSVKTEAQLKAVVAIEGDLDSCCALLKESVQVMEETSRKDQTIKKQKLEHCQIEQQLRDLCVREDYLSRLKQSNEESISRHNAFYLPKIEKAKKKLNKFNQEKLNLEKTKSELIGVMSMEEKKATMCVLERERMKREYDAEYASMIEASKVVNQDLFNYTQQLKYLLVEGAKEYI